MNQAYGRTKLLCPVNLAPHKTRTGGKISVADWVSFVLESLSDGSRPHGANDAVAKPMMSSRHQLSILDGYSRGELEKETKESTAQSPHSSLKFNKCTMESLLLPY